MRNLKFVLVALLATVFCACSSDDDNNGSNALEGTTWASSNEEQIFTIEFQKTTATFIYQYDDNGDGIFGANETKEESTASYTLDGNNITIKAGKDTATGTVSGTKMTLYTDGSSVIYHKK